MNTIANAIIKFLCKHCRILYLDTFYQACEAVSTFDPSHKKPLYYAKAWELYQNALDKSSKE